MEQAGTVDRGFRSISLPRLLALGAAVFWLHYFLVQRVFGLLNIDQVYFAHLFWLIDHGLKPFADVYSAHLPTYFLLLGPLVQRSSEFDLGFVWVLKATGVAAAAVYPVLLYQMGRRDFSFLLPFLLLFLIFARMTEIRPDTVGLLLFNAGWWSLLRGSERRHILVGAALAGLALLFSARAAVMIVGMAALCAFLCWRAKDAGTFARLVALALGFGAIVLIAYAADPSTFLLMVNAVYLEPAAVMPEVGLAQRLLAPDRLLLVTLIVAALAAAVVTLRRDRSDHRALVVAAACLTQLALILVDPSPYQYVYGWAALPALAGLSLLGRWSVPRLHAALGALAFVLAGSLLWVSLASYAANGTPLPGSFFRLSYDAPFATGELARAPTPRLLAMMVSTERQQALWNQIDLLSEVCRRIREPALTRFYANPICLGDRTHDWPGLKWPAVFEGDTSPRSRREFEELFAARPPKLVAWGRQHYRPRLNPWGRRLLHEYDIYDGFAVRRERAGQS